MCGVFRYFMYKLVSQIRFFSVYRLWKGFRTWKRHLQSRKSTTVSTRLQDRLFILDEDFSASVLLAVSYRCEQLCQSLNLQALQPHHFANLEDLKVLLLEQLRLPVLPNSELPCQ